jgi:hypothetical protein
MNWDWNESNATAMGCLVLLVFSISAAPATQPATGETTSKKIALVLSKEAKQQTEAYRAEFGAEFEPKVEVFSCIPIADFRDGQSRAWLVSWSVGLVPGNALLPIYRARIVAENGAVIAEFADFKSGEGTVLLKAGRGVASVAFYQKGGRPYTGLTTIYTLEAKPHLVFSFTGTESPTSSARLYVGDIDADGVREILVATVKRDFKTMVRFREYAAYTFDAAEGRYQGPTACTSDQFYAALARAREGGEVVELQHAGPPYESSLEEGLREGQQREGQQGDAIQFGE